MCGLCGVLGGDEHWSETGSSPAVFGGRAEAETRRQERLRRAQLANKVLAPHGLKLRDWQGASYLLTNRTGKSLVVQHLAQLWPAAAELAGRPLDPLAPATIDHVEQLSAG